MAISSCRRSSSIRKPDETKIIVRGPGIRDSFLTMPSRAASTVAMLRSASARISFATERARNSAASAMDWLGGTGGPQVTKSAMAAPSDCTSFFEIACAW